MELDHKVFELITADGKDAKISDVKNIKVLFNGFDFGVYVIPRENNPKKLFLNACGEPGGHYFEAFSIIDRFKHDPQSGLLVHDDMHVQFFDDKTQTELLVKRVRKPSFWMESIFAESLTEAESHELMKWMKDLVATTAEKEEEKPAVIETEIVIPEPQPEPLPVVENPAPEIKPEEVVAEPVVEVKVEEPPVQEEVIPQEVLDKYELYRNGSGQEVDDGAGGKVIDNGLIGDGYKEFSYKNYRYWLRRNEADPDKDGIDVYLFLLTKEGVRQLNVPSAKMRMVDSDDENTIKYKFLLDGEKKSLYVNVADGTMVVKKPKKGEKDQVIAVAEPQAQPEEAKPEEVKVEEPKQDEGKK